MSVMKKCNHRVEWPPRTTYHRCSKCKVRLDNMAAFLFRRWMKENKYEFHNERI